VFLYLICVVWLTQSSTRRDHKERHPAAHQTTQPARPSLVALQLVLMVYTCRPWYVTVKRMSDERYSWPILSANKIGQQKSVVCHAKIGRICLPPKSSDFVVQVEHVLFSTRKSRNFLECQAVIGQQSVYTTNLWYRIHAVDMCSCTSKYADQLTLKQMHDQQISNQRRTHTVRFLCCFAVTIAYNIEACAYLSSAIFCHHCRDVRSDVCYGSMISSADFLTKLNHAHKSWRTLSIVWLLL